MRATSWRTVAWCQLVAARWPYFLPLPFWDSALAAAVFEAAEVRPLRSTLVAAVAALLEVYLLFLAILAPHGR